MYHKILIRADGCPDIGLGHLVRCIALAQMIKQKFEIIFVCIAIPEVLRQQLISYSFGLKLINVESEFFTLIDSNTVIVLDGYQFDTSYQREVKDKCAKLLIIDDLHDKEIFADLVINHCPGISPNDYNAQAYTKFALGLDYALLRQVFLKQDHKERKIEEINTILICFGGSDCKNLTQRVLNTVKSFQQFNKIIVITGPSYTVSSEFEELVLSDNKIDHRSNLNENEMLMAMKEADLSIVPASGILFEAISTGCIIISGTYVNNQKSVFENFLKEGLIIDGQDFNDKIIKQAISSAIAIRKRRPNPIDGRSGKRISYKFYETLTNLREVSQNDVELLFLWANDPSVRSYAINKSAILWENHLNWFNEKLSSFDSKIFILEFLGRPVGQIRFDKKNDHWLIDYSIDNKFRGLGFGKIIISKAFSHFNETIIVAYVSQDNLASIQVFNFLEFTKVRDEIHNSEVFNIFIKKV